MAPWNSLMWSLMTDVCRAMGVRTDVPFRELTDREKDIVFHGPAEKKHIFYKAKNSNQAGELDFTYYNAVYTVENALAKVKDEKGMKRVEKFLRRGHLPGLPRHPPVRGGPCAAGCGASRWMRPAQMTLAAADRLGGRACRTACRRRCAPWPQSICDSFRRPRRTAAGSGAWLPDAGPRGVHAFHR